MIAILVLLVLFFLVVAGTIVSILLQPSIEAEYARALAQFQRRQVAL